MTTIRLDVKARILREAARATYPREALGTIALSHELTIDEVKDVVQQHGWPRPESMLRAAEILDRRAQIEVHPDTDNVRDELGDIQDLAESLTQIGMLQPILVRRLGDRLVVVAGHRRLAAARLLGWTDVPVVMRPLSPDDVLVAMIHENGQRRDLDPIEEARAYAALKARDDLKDLELARRLGKAQSHVSSRLALLDLTPEDQEAIRAGTMTLNSGVVRGRKLSGKHRANAQGKASAAHLSFNHPLASAAEAVCRQLGHSKMTSGRVGGIACGSCWEAVIRSDERNIVQRKRPTEVGSESR